MTNEIGSNQHKTIKRRSVLRSMATTAAIVLAAFVVVAFIADHVGLNTVEAAPTLEEALLTVPVAHAEEITCSTSICKLSEVEAKLEAMKDGIVSDLATKCETKDVKEPDAAIILDSNNRMSIGSWMYQITTIQHYVKKFENRDINRVEAIEIAVNHEKARALTHKIIFQEAGGLEANWTNCARSLGLSPKVAIIKELEK